MMSIDNENVLTEVEQERLKLILQEHVGSEAGNPHADPTHQIEQIAADIAMRWYLYGHYIGMRDAYQIACKDVKNVSEAMVTSSELQ